MFHAKFTKTRDYLVEAHGSFASARCIDCKQEVNIELVKGMDNS